MNDLVQRARAAQVSYLELLLDDDVTEATLEACRLLAVLATERRISSLTGLGADADLQVVTLDLDGRTQLPAGGERWPGRLERH